MNIKTVFLAGLIALNSLAIGFAQVPGDRSPLALELRHQVPIEEGSKNYHRILNRVEWDPKKTALVICDVWDSHHCLNAVRRVKQLAPRIDQLAHELRSQGVTVIHAPSDCMDFYKDHPARKRAIAIPIRSNTPEQIAKWCDQIEGEASDAYPVDQSDGGEDDDPAEHAQWASRLSSLGRDPKRPWIRQIEAIEIDSDTDFVSDSGKEIWNILQSRGIKRVVVCGVHTNMCVLGRPFGLRQLKQHGFEPVLVRDLTDTMYNPLRWPYVNHFSGTDRVIDHIERVVCPTVSSEQWTGQKAFQFQGDTRKHWVVLIAEDEYKTDQTLVRWAKEQLEKEFRVSFVFSRSDNPYSLVGLDVISQADALLVSVRRRPLPADELNQIRAFVASGKPVLGIRTASHAFSLRGKQPSEGLTDWPEFDAEVFGGNYTNHHGNDLIATISIAKHSDHPLVSSKDFGSEIFQAGGSLYKVSPLRPGTNVLWVGQIANQPAEPVAWSFVRADAGRSFYTSLGHEHDFENDTFSAFLLNAAHWLVDSNKRYLPADIEHQQHMVERGEGKQR
jgi:nicotinamidase-related amidase/type 1 glutamine amidotransferase